MGRKRKSGEKLPKYVYRKGNWFIYRPYADGKLGKPIPLVRSDAPLSDVWAAWEGLQHDERPTVRELMRRYIQENNRLAPRTVRDYGRYADLLAETPLRGGRPFGDVDPDSVTQLAIRQYLDRNEATPIAANRRIQFLKAAYSWALERGRVRANPCVGVRLHRQKPRSRYVTDQEYDAVLALAKEWAAGGRYPYLWIMFELQYLLRARRCEVERLRRQDIKDGFIEWERTKGSRPERTRLSPRLQAVVSAAKRLEADILSPWLVHRRGQRITKNAYDSARQRLMAEAIAQGLIDETFTGHDLKAKGVSDHPTKHSGHRSERMREVYDRKPDEVEATR